MILVGWEQPLVSPHDPMILDIHNCHYPRSACPPGSPNCQLLLRHLVSHSHALDSPLSKFYIVCQVEPTTCTSCCALPNSHLRAGCQCLRCRIPRQSQFSSAYAPDEFSCLAWTFHRQANVRQQSALPIFLWRTYNRINLRCRFLPLLAWLPAPSGPVLASLPKEFGWLENLSIVFFFIKIYFYLMNIF